MEILHVDRNNCLTEETNSFAERRLLFALSRFDSRIDSVVLTVDDVNGPRGGVDKFCQAVVKLRRSPDVIISDKDADLKTCIARVADRAGRTVARRVRRLQNSYRRRLPRGFEPNVEFDNSTEVDSIS